MSHGQTLGRYTLIEQLAIGGMAEIWLAHMAGPEGFEKVVVIKKIRPHLRGQKNFLNMFLNEARLAAHLNHPNIVQIHEFGKPNDQYYIAMEYIFGRDLSEIVPKAKRANIPFPIEYATKIIAQVCEGLYYAHTKSDNKGQPLKIIHRDISPQNVLVSFDGHVKILDFGIAKAANQYEQTQQGILKGKVSYMAPEQILGDGFDCRADIFSLGAVFYELLTGYKLFSGDNELAILRSITDGPIYPPSYFNEDIPDELEEIILKALAKDPDERYPSAWEMQRALNQLLIQFDFHPTNTHLANFLKQLFEDEIEQESQYLESKINEVVRGKQKEESELIELGEPLHEEDEIEDEPSIVVSAKAASTPAPTSDQAEDTAQREVPTQERPVARKVNYDTRPDIEPYTLSEEDEIPSFEEEFRALLLDPDDLPPTLTSSNPASQAALDFVYESDDAKESEHTPEELEEAEPYEQLESLEALEPLDPAESMASLDALEAVEAYQETTRNPPKDPTQHELKLDGALTMDELPPPPQHPPDPFEETANNKPAFDDHQLSQLSDDPGTLTTVGNGNASYDEGYDNHESGSATVTPAPRTAPPSNDESISQILYTIRFRSDVYDDLRAMAQYHEMGLEELLHAMIDCARPFFDTDPNNQEHGGVEPDLNPTSR